MALFLLTSSPPHPRKRSYTQPILCRVRPWRPPPPHASCLGGFSGPAGADKETPPNHQPQCWSCFPVPRQAPQRGSEFILCRERKNKGREIRSGSPRVWKTLFPPWLNQGAGRGSLRCGPALHLATRPAALPSAPPLPTRSPSLGPCLFSSCSFPAVGPAAQKEGCRRGLVMESQSTTLGARSAQPTSVGTHPLLSLLRSRGLDGAPSEG